MGVKIRILKVDSSPRGALRHTWTRLARWVESDLEVMGLERSINVRMLVTAASFKSTSSRLQDLGGDIDGWAIGTLIALNPSINSDARRYAILMHEVGHALGLDHTETRGSIMQLTCAGHRGELTPKRRLKWAREVVKKCSK